MAGNINDITIDPEAQAEYDHDPVLREMLARAAASPTVHRSFEYRR